jgi:hypothetical protein
MDQAAFQAEVGGYGQQKSKQIKITLYADERYAELIAQAFRVGTLVAVAALVDPTTGEIPQ